MWFGWGKKSSTPEFPFRTQQKGEEYNDSIMLRSSGAQRAAIPKKYCAETGTFIGQTVFSLLSLCLVGLLHRHRVTRVNVLAECPH